MSEPTAALLKKVKDLESQIADLKREMLKMEKRVVTVGTRFQKRQDQKLADLIKSRINMLGK